MSPITCGDITVDSRDGIVIVYRNWKLIGEFKQDGFRLVTRAGQSSGQYGSKDQRASWRTFTDVLHAHHAVPLWALYTHRPAYVPLGGSPFYVTLDIESLGEPGYFGDNWLDKRKEFIKTFADDALASVKALLDTKPLLPPTETVDLFEGESVVVHAGVDDISFVIARTPRGVIVTVNQPDIDGRVGIIYDEPTVDFENDK